MWLFEVSVMEILDWNDAVLKPFVLDPSTLVGRNVSQNDEVDLTHCG